MRDQMPASLEPRGFAKERLEVLMSNPAMYAADEAQLADLLEEYAAAIRAKDARAVVALYAWDFVAYELAPPLQIESATARDPEYLFACGVYKYGDSNLKSSWAQCERGTRLYTEMMMGHPARNRQRYLDASPIHQVEQIQRPVLLLHGLLDDVCPPASSDEWVEALRRADKAFEYQTYAGEPHGFLKPQRMRVGPGRKQGVGGLEHVRHQMVVAQQNALGARGRPAGEQHHRDVRRVLRRAAGVRDRRLAEPGRRVEHPGHVTGQAVAVARVGEDDRVVQAAQQFRQLAVGQPVVQGREGEARTGGGEHRGHERRSLRPQVGHVTGARYDASTTPTNANGSANTVWGNFTKFT